MQFGNPEILYFLWAVPGLALFFFWSWRRKQKALLEFAESSLLKHLIVRTSSFKQILKLLLILGGSFFLLAAAARPQWGARVEVARRQGIDLLIVLDGSLSMDTRDIVPSRLEKAKHEIRSLLEKLQGDRTGLILFAGMPIVSCPLTIDQGALEMFLDIANPQMVPLPGTNIGEAIRLAVSSFNPAERRTKLIFLVTDGEDLEGDAVKAAEAAHQAGIRIYALGVGTGTGEPVPLLDEQGNPSGYKKNENGSVVVSRLDQPLLAQIAATTGGKFFLASPGEDEIDQIAGEIAGMNRQELQSKLFLTRIDRFQLPLAIGLFLMFLETLMTDQSWRKPAFRWLGLPRWFTSVVLLLILMSGPAWADQKSRRNAAGNRYFKQKDYSAALKEYVEAQNSNKYSEELSYNIGNTLYEQKKYLEALKEYEKVFPSPNQELNQRTQFNRGNAFFRSGDFNQAAASYRKALEMNPADLDAKHNLELALQKLQQQQKQQDQPPKNQGKKQEQDQQNQAQQKQDQSGQHSKQSDKKDQQPQSASGKEQTRKPDSQNQQPPSKGKGGMDPREARQILEAFENQEKKEQRQQVRQLKQQSVRGKDW
jgi:Ca-activated chloride channel homolog